MQKAIIAVIGAGNMGSAIIGGLIAAGHEPLSIRASGRRLSSLDKLKALGIHITIDNIEAAMDCDVLILATKPQQISTVLTELAPLIEKQKPLLISVAAGSEEARLRKQLPGNPSIVIAMPNTPALIRSGVTTLYANAFVTKAQKQLVEEIFNAVGHTIWLDNEQHLHTITALSGTGPAYFFLLMEALQQAAIQLGLPDNIAKTLTIHTALGSARMAEESQQDLDMLRKQVTSPGGGTERALSVLLESNKFHTLVFQAVQAAQQRYQEMATKE
ncbi:MAG TPA: pyrroline-5-carboxylate reductase [Gammaproteobacteria bacterium]|nr:pyrroline-5-carboxylate reductase [Gammaproteobacteria bacterium]